MPAYAPGQTRKRNVNDVLEILDKDGAKNILVRVDFNVPMDADLNITDDSRIRGAIPTIEIILKSGNNAILMSHMGRPKKVQKGEDDDGSQRASLSLKAVVPRLTELTGADVRFVDDCIGDKVKEAVAELPGTGGSILVLENLRFRKVRVVDGDLFSILFFVWSMLVNFPARACVCALVSSVRTHILPNNRQIDVFAIAIL